MCTCNIQAIQLLGKKHTMENFFFSSGGGGVGGGGVYDVQSSWDCIMKQELSSFRCSLAVQYCLFGFCVAC